MTLKSGSTTLYTDEDSVYASNTYGETVKASLHSGFYSMRSITSTTTHTLTGTITYSRTLVSSY